MPSPLFSEIEAGTTEAYVKDKVARTVFTATPFLRMLKTNSKIFRRWEGGSYMKVPFDLQPVPSGAYSPGTDTFGLQQLQTQDAMEFSPRFYESEVVINATVTDVYNMGPYKIFDILKQKYDNAANSLDSKFAAAIFNHGQPRQTTVAQDRTKELNGFAEAINDGLTPSWTGDIFTTYGGQTRNSAVLRNVLNSIPFWGGNSDGSAGQVSYQLLNATYNRCRTGKGLGDMVGGLPDYGLASDFLYGQICAGVFPAQRVDVTGSETRSPSIGLAGLKFNNAIIFRDSYVPGTQNSIYVLDQSVLPSVTTGTFTLPASAAGQLNGFQNVATGTTINVNETFWWLNSDSWKFSYPTTGRYAFKNRGLENAYDGDMMADIIRAAAVLYCTFPGANQLVYGFAG